MSHYRCLTSLTSMRLIPGSILSMQRCAAYYTTITTSSSPKAPQVSPSDANKTQQRYLQTITAHQPANLLENGTPPPRNADAPVSSLMSNMVYQTPPQPPPAALGVPTKPNIEPLSKKVVSTSTNTSTTTNSGSASTQPTRISRLRTPRKAAMTLTPSAISQLCELLNGPDPKMIRVGVKNRGCSGLAYHLEYTDKPGKFDETVEQGGVKVLIDSKALFSIIGSEMDWVEDKLSARFVFKNPNIKEQCGCGESFSVGN